MFMAGDRISLRPIDETSVEQNTRWVNDPEIRRYTPYHTPTTVEQRKNWLLGIEKASGISNVAFTIWHNQDQVPIGYILLFDIHWINQTAEIGILIGEKQYWNQGYGSEAVELICRYGFSELHLNKLRAVVAAKNEGSLHIFKKLGFSSEGCLKSEVYTDGEYLDLHYFALFKKGLSL